MSRLEEAVLSLNAGGAIVLADEDREGLANLVAAADVATPDTLLALADKGRGAPELIWGSGHPGSAGLGGEGRVGPDGASASIPGRQDPDSEDLLNRLAETARAAVEGRTSGREFAELGTVARRATAGGVLVRAGRAEGAIDMLRMAGRPEIALLRAVGLPGGVLALERERNAFAEHHRLPLVTIQDVVAHRLATETIIESAASARLPSVYAEVPLEVRAFRNLLDGSEHLAMVHGPLGAEPLVRLHSECLTGDALGSLRCDCGDQLRRSLRLVADSPSGGAVIYLRGQEGRGIGLVNKIRAYALQDLGRDTVQANVDLGFAPDPRDYGVAIQILESLGIKRLQLLSNNPRKAAALERYGIEVAARVPLRIGPNPHNQDYLETKRLKLGHDLAVRPMAGIRPRQGLP